MSRFLKKSRQAFRPRFKGWLAELKNPEKQRIIFVLALVFLGLIFAESAFAQEPVDTSQDWGDKIIMFFASIFLGLAQVLGTIFALLVEVSISIMQYNNFADSPMVTTGWVIVRDVINLFFVLVLIIIAMGTMFGASKFKWMSMVPRLLLFALIINFSRTICVIMIDLGQVVMLTFANAIKDVAGGNFINMFGIVETMRLSQAEATSYGPWGFLAAALMAFFVMGAVTITLGALVLILVFRIVLLWILIVLSPLAFFLGGVKDLFGANGYADWWKQFKCAVLIGPILTFFLWLTLSVAGSSSGSVAVTEGFVSSATSGDNIAAGLNRIFEKGNFMSLLISLGMIYGGFNAAMSFCGSDTIIAGVAGTAKRYVGTAAKWTAGGALGLAVLSTSKGYGAFKEGAGLAATGISRGVSDAAQNITPLRGLTSVGRAEKLRAQAAVATDPAKASRLSAKADKLETKVASDYMEAGKGVEGMSHRSITDTLQAVARGGVSKMPGQRREQAVMMAKAMNDPKMRKELEESGAMEKLYPELQKDLGILKKDEKMGASIKAFEKSNPQITNKWDDIQTPEDMMAVDAAAWRTKDGREFLEKTEMGVPPGFNDQFRRRLEEKGEKVRDANAYDYFASGQAGTARKNALTQGLSALPAGVLDVRAPETLVGSLTVDMVNKSPQMVQNIMTSNNPIVQKELGNLAANNRELYEQMLKQSAGIDLQGNVQDSAKLRNFAAQGPGALGNISTRAISGPVASEIIASLKASDWQKAAGQIQKSPDENRMLRANMTRLSQAVAQGTADDETLAAATNFDLQMETLDRRQNRPA